MWHSLVQARFDPLASAYWLPETGRKTAARIPAWTFWALRMDLSESQTNDYAPPDLFMLSNQPSPYPFPESTLKIGPKCALPSGKRSHADADLLVKPPLPTTEDLLHSPLFLHTVPRLRCNFLYPTPLEDVFFMLRRDHLVKFVDTALKALSIACENRLQGYRAFRREVPGHRGISTKRPLPIARNLTYLFGELHDPRSYVFKFSTLDEFTFPEKLESTLVYESILIYNQVCIDYRWEALEATMNWVKETRTEKPPRWFMANRPPDVRAGAFPSFPSLQTTAEAVWDGESLFFGAGVHSDPDLDLFLPFAFPQLALEYPRIPLGRPKVIAFDLFGILLDREGAILRALEPWSPPSGLSSSDLAALYIETEVSLAHDWRAQASSLAAIVRSALIHLATAIDMPKDWRTASVAEATRIILNPSLFPGAADALVYLAQHRYTLIYIPPFSESTMQHVQSALPAQLMDILHICPAAASPHFSSEHIFPALLRKCNTLVPSGVQPHEIVVVSTGMGRMLAPALAQGCVTALVRRPGCLEAHVNFRVGRDVASPVPSITVDGLSGLCRKLKHFSFLVPDEGSVSSPGGLGHDGQANAGIDTSGGDSDSPGSPTDAADADTTDYIWSFTIRGAYQATQFLGEGTHASVFRTFHTLTGSETAAKIEAIPAEEPKRPFLEHEIAVYQLFYGAPLGIPTVHWFGRDGNFAVLILERLGPTLSHLRRFCRGVFTLRTICLLAEQMLARLEFAHSRGVVVCDVKPQNFAMGMGATANVLYLLDFGHAALYIDPYTGAHVPPDRRRHAIGTMRYTSVAAHLRQAVSRRDDVESLLYVLLDLYTGDLPWRELRDPKISREDIKTQESRIRESKTGADLHDLLAGLPPEFSAYHAHCAGLAFGQAPDYDYLRELFRARMYAERWGYDADYDWVCGGSRERGTLIPEEYVLDLKLVCADVDLEPY